MKAKFPYNRKEATYPLSDIKHFVRHSYIFSQTTVIKRGNKTYNKKQ